jgi:hypothetical protein
MAAFKAQFELYHPVVSTLRCALSPMVPSDSILEGDGRASGDLRSRSKYFFIWLRYMPDEFVATQFVAIKIFSILPNSMPEERTVSRFTRNDAVDQASQDASTIVDMPRFISTINAKRRRVKKSVNLLMLLGQSLLYFSEVQEEVQASIA